LIQKKELPSVLIPKILFSKGSKIELQVKELSIYKRDGVFLIRIGE